MSEYKEETGLIINTEGVDSFCLSSARELSITRDVAERLVFAQMSEITSENVCDYYSRLSLLSKVYSTSPLLTGIIFDDNGNDVTDHKLTVIDFISRVGITTNLAKDTLRNFLDRTLVHLTELYSRSLIDISYDYEMLLDLYGCGVDHFLSICDINQIGRVDNAIHAAGVVRALDLAQISTTIAAIDGEDRNG
jgi:hypothetical protein